MSTQMLGGGAERTGEAVRISAGWLGEFGPNAAEPMLSRLSMSHSGARSSIRECAGAIARGAGTQQADVHEPASLSKLGFLPS